MANEDISKAVENVAAWAVEYQKASGTVRQLRRDLSEAIRMQNHIRSNYLMAVSKLSVMITEVSDEEGNDNE